MHRWLAPIKQARKPVAYQYVLHKPTVKSEIIGVKAYQDLSKRDMASNYMVATIALIAGGV